MQLLGLQGGWPHVVTVTATNAGGEGEAVAVIANPHWSGKSKPALEAPGGVGTLLSTHDLAWPVSCLCARVLL